MQRNRRRYLVFGLLSFAALGAIGALATGLVPPPWTMQPWSLSPQVAPAGPAQAAKPEKKLKTAAVPPSNSATTPAKPRKFGIDVARITTNGESVIAGFAKPSSRITLMADGKPVASVVSDASGDWLLVTPYKFTSLDPKLEVREGDLTAPRLASLPGPTTSRASTPTERTAAAVAQQMMRHLEKLTVDASNTTSATPKQLVSVTPAASTQPAASPSATANSTAATTTSPSIQTLAVPVQFVYREATFTGEGEAAAAKLLAYFKAKQFSAISMSGHADERGTAAANFKLSRERLEHLERFLRDGGYAGTLTLVPKGATERYTRVDRTQFPLEELYQLDRRVEVIAAR